jgi:heme-degrading monooxygenase HmoA
MVVTVFRSRLLPGHDDEFRALADEMMEQAEAMPGFRSYKLYTSEDGERCSVIEFETTEQLMAWRQHAGHQKAMRIGRERFYSEYSSFVGEPIRESRFTR